MKQHTKTEPIFAVRNVVMAYGSFVLMREVTFDILPGQIFVIMGGSGCGKSTLMKHLLGLLRPAEGEISYHGVPLDLDDDDQRREVLC